MGGVPTEQHAGGGVERHSNQPTSLATAVDDIVVEDFGFAQVGQVDERDAIEQESQDEQVAAGNQVRTPGEIELGEATDDRGINRTLVSGVGAGEDRVEEVGLRRQDLAADRLAEHRAKDVHVEGGGVAAKAKLVEQVMFETAKKPFGEYTVDSNIIATTIAGYRPNRGVTGSVGTATPNGFQGTGKESEKVC